MGSTRLIIGAPRSGSGKTTLTLAILAALRRRGLRVRAAKSGPDYIDPAFHAAASGAPCPNLDSWAMAPAQFDCVAADVAKDADVVLIESAMGLFDGVAAAPGRSGAAADLAARYRLPVLLVLDVSGQSQTAAAVARGFMLHDPAVRIAGVVLNRVGSDRHHEGIARAMAPLGLPLLGSVPRDSAIALPERHLGLVQAGEHDGLADLLERLADLAERTLDLDGILAHAATWQPEPSAGRMLPPPGQRIALASDAAFSFVYPHLLSAWRSAGAEIVAIFAAGRCRTARRLRRLLAAGRLSGTARRGAGQRRALSAPVCCGSRKPGRCTASAAATWCWDPCWKMRLGRDTRCSACWTMPQALPGGGCISATARRRCCSPAPLEPRARWCGATSTTTPASLILAPTRRWRR